LIGTIRRECLGRTVFWTAADLEVKLLDFQRYLADAIDVRPNASSVSC